MGAGRSVTVKVIASVTTICASLIISYQCTHLHHISFTSRSLHTSSKQKQKPVLVQNSRLEPRSSARADRSSDGMDAICLSSADVAISDVGSVHIQRTSRNHISSITYGSQHISLSLVRFGPTTMSWVWDRARPERPSQAHRLRSRVSAPSFLFFPPTIPVALGFIHHISSAGVHTQTRYGSKSPYLISGHCMVPRLCGHI